MIAHSDLILPCYVLACLEIIDRTQTHASCPSYREKRYHSTWPYLWHMSLFVAVHLPPSRKSQKCEKKKQKSKHSRILGSHLPPSTSLPLLIHTVWDYPVGARVRVELSNVKLHFDVSAVFCHQPLRIFGKNRGLWCDHVDRTLKSGETLMVGHW